ncbi:hypothetical protein Tco_1192269 [Tanacetum coccineum]
MEIDIKEDENEPELTYPYEEVDPLNPSPPASESEPDNEIEVENLIEHEDETVPVSVYEVGESSTAAIPREDGDRLLPGFMRRDTRAHAPTSPLGRMVNFSRRLCGREMAHALVEKKGEAKDSSRMLEKKAECKKLKKELEEARFNSARFQEVQSLAVTGSGDETSSGIVVSEEIDKQKLGAPFTVTWQSRRRSPLTPPPQMSSFYLVSHWKERSQYRAADVVGSESKAAYANPLISLVDS